MARIATCTTIATSRTAPVYQSAFVTVPPGG
jgi:hypothetical protein